MFYTYILSIFVEPVLEDVEYAAKTKVDRIELYTEDYAKGYDLDKENAIKPYLEVTEFLQENIPSVSLNAGHDLNLKNLNYLLTKIPTIKEVSIGHALVCDAFEYGLKDTIQKYLTIAKR